MSLIVITFSVLLYNVQQRKVEWYGERAAKKGAIPSFPNVCVQLGVPVQKRQMIQVMVLLN